MDDAYLDLGALTTPVPDSAEALTVAHAYSGGFAQGCVERTGAYAGQVGTRNTARDLEAIRIALGEPKLNYLGFSYGTIIGATYAQMFPTNVRAMVLDGPPDYWLSRPRLFACASRGIHEGARRVPRMVRKRHLVCTP